MSSSLSKKVLCINLRTSCLGTSSTDAVLTEDLRTRTGAMEGSLKATKKILDEAVTPFRKLRTEFRKYFASVTLPGISDDLRITTPKRLDEIQKKLAEYEEKDAELVAELQANYVQHITDDMTKLGAAFDPKLYPPVENLPQFFTLRLTVCDLPAGDYFRVEGLTDDAIQKMKDDHAKMIAAVSATAKNEVHKKLVELITHVADKLSDPNAKKFYDSTFDNLKDYLAKVPDLNITNDPQLEAMRKEAEEKLNFTMAQVKANSLLKEQAAANAKAILATFGGGQRKLLVSEPVPPAETTTEKAA